MPSRRSQKTAAREREERKKRQEKFRKRTKSLFNKTRLLAKDTDAWVALIVRDRAGRVQSFRSSGRLYWPPSIQDLITTHPSDTHEFLEKHAISGGWKEVAEDGSDGGLVDDAESVDEGLMAISVMPVEKEAGPDSTISVEQCYMDEDDANARGNEIVVEKSVVDQIGELDITPRVQCTELDGQLVAQLHATIDTDRESGRSRVDSPGKDAAFDSGMDDTRLEYYEPDIVMVDATKESDEKTIDKIVDSHNTTAPELLDSDNVLDTPIEGIPMDILGMAELDPIALEYDTMDDVISDTKSTAQPDVRNGDPIEAANTLYTLRQHHNPPSSGGLGSWNVVNRLKMDPKELLQSWNWVFQSKYQQQEV